MTEDEYKGSLSVKNKLTIDETKYPILPVDTITQEEMMIILDHIDCKIYKLSKKIATMQTYIAEHEKSIQALEKLKGILNYDKMEE